MMKFEGNYTYFLNVNAKVIMKKIIIVTALFFSSFTMFGQKINGQWRGFFDSKGDITQSSADNIEYVLEIEINGTEITGYSYSYFQNRRYFVICSLGGTYYKSTNSMKVTETARIKGSTPPDWSDCLQTHILTYEKEAGKEELKGRWIPAEGQLGNCGKGVTTLTRRTLSKDLASFNKSKAGTPFSKDPSAVKPADPATKKTTLTTPVIAAKPKTAAPVTKPTGKPTTATPVAKTPMKPKSSTESESALVRNKIIDRNLPDVTEPEIKKQSVTIQKPEMEFDKRASDIIKTIEISNATFKVDLYDNGDIDGDSISLFYNGKLVLSRKRLTDKPISLTLEVNNGKAINELTMYAENLGIIPPNTALMVIIDGEKRYEVRIASDLKKSGTIRFAHKASAPNP